MTELEKQNKQQQVGFVQAMIDASGEGSEEHRRAHDLGRELNEQIADAPRFQSMVGSNPLITRLREMMGMADPNHVEARERMGLGAQKGTAARAGQMVGTIAGDLTQDRSRSVWWLLNALQAVGNVGAEAAYNAAAPDLYSASTIKDDLGPIPIKDTTRAQVAGALDSKTGRKMRGIGEREYRGDRYFTKRNHMPGHVAMMNIAPGVAINSGLGLLTPFGGAEGYEAAVPSKEDKSKTENVLAEVAVKYILGRTGNLLPYSEFSKVRPDVSKEEYNRYKAFKWNKEGDMDLSDGDFTVPTGVIKGTSEGIHGPEVQFLGRSLPLTTGILPYATAVGGGVTGLRTGKKVVRNGLLGSAAGLVGGQVSGNLIEQERRRRNKEENERQYNKRNDMSLE